jgi:hypothetical protein
MNYRSAGDARFYLCPGCSTPQQGPPAGGQVACPQCRAPFVLPDRGAMLGNPGGAPMPQDDPGRLQQLRLQDGRPRIPAPTLVAVLGGAGIQAGREQEAFVIWQSLRARSTQGDVAASEDLATLTLLMAQLPVMDSQPQLLLALSESAYDACVLPRHKIEQLGRLVRRAAAAGDRARAGRYLSWMMPGAPELEADSEYRVSYAVVATLDRDAARVLALLGPRKDAIPIVDSMDPLATVFRANAHELLGNPPAAAEVLRELPDPRALDMVRQSFSSMQLCPQSGQSFAVATTQAAAKRASASAGGLGCLVGAILAFIGGIFAIIGLVTLAVSVAASNAVPDAGIGATMDGGSLVFAGIGVVLLCVGIFVILRARAAGKRAAWLRVNGLSLQARVVGAEMTGTRINDVPVYRFVLQVEGPQGPYGSSFTKLVAEHQVAMLMGSQVRVRANPQKLNEVVLEE